MNNTKSHTTADVYCARLHGKQTINATLPKDKLAWVKVAKGSLMVNDKALKQGDGLAIEGSGELTFYQGNRADFLYVVLG